jgi:23S rRNA (uracil1939-C5)-methyltransferase
MKKGDIVEGKIERVTFPNKGHICVDDRDVIVKNTIPGQLVRARINKKKAGRLEAQLLEVTKHSPLEKRPPLCKNFPACGGCLYQTMEYEDQLKLKEDEMRELLAPAIAMNPPEEDGPADVNEPAGPDELAAVEEPSARTETETCEGRAGGIFEGILPSPDESGYRNKMEYAFGNAVKDGPLTLGLHRKNSTYDILTADDCILVHPDFNAIVKCVLECFRGRGIPHFHKVTHEGWLRHLLVRRAAKTGEILIDLVTTSQALPNGEAEESVLAEFTERLQALALEGTIVGILHTVNDSVADVIRNDWTDLLFGRDYFFEELLGLSFRVTPFSFFQTNTRGAEVLYRTAIDFLGDVSGKTVFDLYTGTGTIAQVLAPVAKKVVGVEIVEEAVEAAKKNAAANGLDNCSFIAGDVLKVLDDLTEKPDVIVLDPPRDGIHPKALPKIISYGVDRIVYISCKPTSLARDLEVFRKGGYRITRIRCVDLFVNTAHTEVVCALKRIK